MHVSIIGAGNVASHFARAMAGKGHVVDVVWSRDVLHAMKLADEVGGRALDRLAEVPRTSDVYAVMVPDGAISDVVDAMPLVDGVVIHTSGATSIDVLLRHERRGVVYPCMTFSKDDVVDFSNLPILVEGCDADVESRLVELAGSVSSRVSLATSEQRCELHVAAVLSSNFSNHLIYLAKRHMEENGLDYEVLESLMRQTIDKAFAMDPKAAQTGPARRGDEATIARHLNSISDNDTREIYKILTNSIKKAYR